MSEKKIYTNDGLPPGFIRMLGEVVNVDHVSRMFHSRIGVTVDVLGGAQYVLEGVCLDEVCDVLTAARARR